MFEVQPVKLEEALEEKANLDVEVELEEFVHPGVVVGVDNDGEDVSQANVNGSSLVTEQNEQEQPVLSEQFESHEQETLPVKEESNVECTPQAPVTQNLPKDDHLPSYMPYGQPVVGNEDTAVKDHDDITSVHPNMKENFYVVSPPHTPKTDGKEIVQGDEKVEISKVEPEELSQEEQSASETEVAERASSTSMSSLTNEACSSDTSRESPDFLEVAECTPDGEVDDLESFLPVEKGKFHILIITILNNDLRALCFDNYPWKPNAPKDKLSPKNAVRSLLRNLRNLLAYENLSF